MHAYAFHARTYGTGLALITAIVHFVGCYTPPTASGSNGGAGGNGGADGSSSSSSSGSAGSGGNGGSLVAFAGCPAGIATSSEVKQAFPMDSVNTTYVKTKGMVYTVNANEDLQSVIDAALPGDIIQLQAGATFTGPYTLPEKNGELWITIRTTTPDANLPLEGTRISPADAPKLAKLISPPNSGPVLTFAPGAHHYRLLGLEITSAPGVYVDNLVEIGHEVATSTTVPHHIVIDRSFLHGDPSIGTRRGIALGGAHVGIVDSYLSDFKRDIAEAQAICGWNGPGPYKIVNNHLEGSGETIMFGGAAAALTGNTPSDIVICGNHFYKPLAWKGTSLQVKSHFEIRNAQRVLFAGNILENNWKGGQAGFAVVLSPYGEDGSVPGAVHDLTFTLNHIVHTASAVSILGKDNSGFSGGSKRIVFTNNLFEDVNRLTFGEGSGDGRIFQVTAAGEPVDGLEVTHNTAPLAGNSFLTLGDGEPAVSNLVFRDNLMARGDFGAFGSGHGEGMDALAIFAPNAKFTNNVIFGSVSDAMYPGANFFPVDATGVGFVNYAGNDFALDVSSQYLHAATDGKAVGADIAALKATLVGVVK